MTCRYFGACGGCSLDIPYAEQIVIKKESFRKDCLAVGIELADLRVVTGNQFGYRSRMDFAFAPDGPGQRRKNQFRQIVAIESCLIAQPKVNELLQEVWQFWRSAGLTAYSDKTRTGVLKYAVVRALPFSGDTALTIVLNRNDPQLAEAKIKLREFAHNSPLPNIMVGLLNWNQGQSISQDYEIYKGSDYLTEKLAGVTYRFHSQSFFQNNSEIAQEMLLYCRKIAEENSGKTLIDLYGGPGTFGLALADLFNKVFIIDNDKGNIANAKLNIEQNKLTNVEAILADANYLQELDPEDLFLIVDPPRSGLSADVLKRILELKPKNLIYVSCKPPQLALELPKLLDVYKLKDTVLFDQFPQTDHLEVICWLQIK